VRFATDKVLHGYLPTYLRIAAELGPAAKVCEVGVQAGHGLDMFQALFPDGLVAGVDQDAGCWWPPGTIPVICAQDHPSLPVRLAQHAPAWDLIADDASHRGDLTAATFGLLWPLVAPGGWYVIEDWMVALGWPGFTGDTTMLDTVAGLLRLLTKDSGVEEITYRYGLAVVRKKAA
jgi:hypothetical protein